MAHQQHQLSNYRVEVSGWDAAESFFLERTVLYWDATRQEMTLRSRLRQGAVVFIRLIQPFDVEENFPVPYVVERNLPIEIDGRTTVAIARLHPKPTYAQSAEALEGARARCA
jgi:hypothetical protein